MTPSNILPCSSCGYDLGATPAATGSCPECGNPYNKARDGAEHRAEVSWSLLLIGAGALAYSFAVIVGNSYAYLPSANEGRAGNGYVASRYLSLIPLMAIAYGVVSYVGTSEWGRPRRWWLSALASIAVITGIIGHNSENHWTHVQVSAWMQVNFYRQIAWWIAILGNGFLALLAGLLAHRLAGSLHRPRLRNAALVVMVSAPLVAITALTSELLTRFFPLSSPPPQPAIVNAGARTAIATTSEIAWWFTWPLIGLLVLHLRTLRTSRESCGSIGA